MAASSTPSVDSTHHSGWTANGAVSQLTVTAAPASSGAAGDEPRCDQVGVAELARPVVGLRQPAHAAAGQQRRSRRRHRPRPHRPTRRRGHAASPSGRHAGGRRSASRPAPAELRDRQRHQPAARLRADPAQGPSVPPVRQMLGQPGGDPGRGRHLLGRQRGARPSDGAAAPGRAPRPPSSRPRPAPRVRPSAVPLPSRVPLLGKARKWGPMLTAAAKSRKTAARRRRSTTSSGAWPQFRKGAGLSAGRGRTRPAAPPPRC